MTKYTVTHKPGDTISFWRDCCRMDRPFIIVEEKTRYALVSWDNISLSSQSQYLLNLNRVSIALLLRKIHREYSSNPLDERFVEPFVGYIRTEKERARELAVRIYDALTTRRGAAIIERPLPLGVRQAW